MSDDQRQWLRELSKLRDEVQRLKDAREIAQLRGRCCHCIEMKDWAGYAGLVTEDYEHVSDAGTFTCRDDFIAFVSETLGDSVSVFHAHTEEIDITGADTATAIWTRSGYLIMPGDGSPVVVRSYGHYREDYVRADAGWRLKKTDESTLQLDLENASPAQAAVLAQGPP